MRSFLISNTSQNYNYLLYRIDPNYRLYNPNYYKKRIPQLIEQNNGKLENMYTILSSQTNFNRYQQDKFDQFFNAIFYGNICKALNDFPKYVSSENSIIYEECIKVGDGKFKKGFIIVIKDFLSKFIELSQIYSIQGQEIFRETALKWEKIVSIKDFDDTFVILAKSMDSFKDFMLMMVTEHVDSILFTQTALLIFQFGVLMLVFYLGWIQFYQQVQSDMYLVKSLLSVLPIESVLENPYIISFLNR